MGTAHFVNQVISEGDSFPSLRLETTTKSPETADSSSFRGLSYFGKKKRGIGKSFSERLLANFLSVSFKLSPRRQKRSELSPAMDSTPFFIDF